MRLGELKQKIDLVVDDAERLIIDSTEKYNGQAYVINNGESLFNVLELLLSLKWNDLDSTQIQSIFDQYKPIVDGEEFTQEEFNQLRTYVDNLNNRFPIFYSILDAMIQKQEDRAINIKIPPTINSFESLNKANKRYQDLFKKLNIDGEFEFSGFDVGSSWYVVVPIGILTYQFTIGALKIAQEVLKTRAEYYRSEEARLHYEASLGKNAKFVEAEFDEYKERWLDLKIDQKVKELMENVKERHGQQEGELQTRLIIATKGLIKELGEGTEFHLSLNPPEYAKEKAGALSIDYKKIREINSAETSELKAVKQLSVTAVEEDVAS